MVAPVRSRPVTARPAGPPPFKKRRPFRSDQTVGAMMVAFAVAALLGSESLVNLAEQQPFGPTRTVSLGLARGVDRVAAALALDRPARAVQRWTGKAEPEAVDVDALVRDLHPVPSGAGASAGSPSASAGDGAVGTAGSAAVDLLEVNPLTGRRYITVDEPLRVLLAGDSMMRELADAINDVAPTDLTNIRTEYRISSGLSRPDFFNWPSELARLMQSYRPDSVVVVFGTNDHQDMEADGRVLRWDSAEWAEEYGRRVGQVMDLLGRPGVTVSWVGLPAMRQPEMSAAMDRLTGIYRQQATNRPWVQVIDTGAVVNAADGTYAAAVPRAGGNGTVTVRQPDGIHFSLAGADRAGGELWSDVDQRWDLAGAAQARDQVKQAGS
ncbi:MAG: DUF459 domain-containing protein [Acidimicrobiales bacterium]